MRALPAALLLFCAWTPLVGQYDEDEQTRDYEERDRRYYQRYVEQDPAPPRAEDREETIRAFLSRAEELIRDRNYRSAESQRYRVQSDDPRLDVEATAALLERFRDYFDRFWEGRIALRDYEETSRVFLFYSFHKFNRLLAGDFRFSEIRPKGHYGWLFDAITLHTDADGPGGLPDALLHEAAHQLMDRRIFGEAAPASIWVSEGLASYFGYTFLDADGSFVPGAVGGKMVTLIRGARPRPGRECHARLKIFRQALKTREAPGAPLVQRVVEIETPARFYGTDPLLHYATSWLLVHFLLHGEDGKHGDAFVRYLELESEGRGGADALFRKLGLAPEELQARLARHVKRLKPR